DQLVVDVHEDPNVEIVVLRDWVQIVGIVAAGKAQRTAWYRVGSVFSCHGDRRAADGDRDRVLRLVVEERPGSGRATGWCGASAVDAERGADRGCGESKARHPCHELPPADLPREELPTQLSQNGASLALPKLLDHG